MEATLDLRYIFCMVFVWCTHPMTSLPTSSRGTCSLGDDIHQVGDTWHPVLEPSGEDRCTTCRCNAPGHLSCDRLVCPELHCEVTVRIEGSCCPVCAKRNASSGSPVVSLDTPFSSSSPENNYCRFQGREYSEGDTFPGEELFTGKANNDCVRCTCSRGQINCASTCPDPGCPDPITPDGSCCPVCNSDDISPEHANDIALSALISMSDDITLNNFPPVLESGSEHPIRDSVDEEYVCISGDETYYHGERWHPRLHPFGVTRCVICTCNLGEKACERIQCPADDELPCENPVYVRGKCCKVCVVYCCPNSRYSGDEDPSLLRHFHSAPGELAPGGSSSEAYEPELGSTQIPLCLSGLHTHLFYAYQPLVVSREGADYGIMYAVEDIKHGTVRIAQWEITSGEISTYMMKDISSASFQRATVSPDQQTGRFALIGATTKQRYKKLLKREAKLKRRCRGDCLNDVIKLTKVLRITEVERSSNCSQSATTASSKRRRSV